MPFLLVLFFMIIPFAYALQGGSIQVDYAEFEPAKMQDMVNLQTGDFAYSVPLGDVPGPYGNYPLSVSYHAGITPNQEATWVGLGWILNPGVVNRNVRGVPDDQFHGGTLGFIYQYSAREIWNLDLGFTTGIFGLGLNSSAHGGVGYSATIGPKIDGIAGAGFTLGSNGVGLSSVLGGRSGGLNSSLLFSTQNGKAIISAQGYAGNFLRASFGASYSSGHKMASAVGFSANQGNERNQMGLTVSSKGVYAWTKIGQSALRTGKSGTTFSVGSAFSVSNSVSFGKTKSTSTGFGVIIPTSVGAFSLGYNKSLQEYYNRSATSDYVYGYMYQAGPGIVADGENEISYLPEAVAKNERSNSSIPWHWSKKGRNLESMGKGLPFPAYDMYTVSSEGTSGMFHPFARETHQLLRQYSDSLSDEHKTVEYYTPVLSDSLPADNRTTVFPYVNEFKTDSSGNLILSGASDYDYKYCFNAKNCSPYAFYETHFRNSGNRLVYRKNKEEGDTLHSGMHFLFAGESGGYFESENEGEALGRNKNQVSKKLLYKELEKYEHALYGSKKVEPILENNSPTGKISGFIVTNPDGSKYYFTQPVRSYLKVDYTINQEKGVPLFIDQGKNKTENFWKNFRSATKDLGLWMVKNYSENLNYYNILKKVYNFANPSGTLEETCNAEENSSDDLFYSYLVQMNPYATQWLLTEIRGADFVDRDTAIEKNSGYQVRFKYSKPTLYRYRTPFARPGLNPDDLPNIRISENGYTPEGCDSRMFQGSFGLKEVVYLKSIETATHKVEFILNDSLKEERVDGKGFEMNSENDSDKIPIYVQVYLKADLDYESKGTLSYKVNDVIHNVKKYSYALTPRWIYLNTEIPELLQDNLKNTEIKLLGLNKNPFDYNRFVKYTDNDSLYNSGSMTLKLKLLDTADAIQKTKGEESRYGLYKMRVYNSGITPTVFKVSTNGNDSFLAKNATAVFGESGTYKETPYVNFGDVVWANNSEKSNENRMRYLKQINYYNKSSSKPYRKYIFDYDYSLQPKTLNSYCTGLYPKINEDIKNSPDSVGLNICNETSANHLYGKLTLKSITEFGCRGSFCISLPPFQFSYNASSATSTRLSSKNAWMALSNGLNEVLDESGKVLDTVAQFSEAYYKNITDVDASVIASNNAIDEWGFWNYNATEENRKVNQELADFNAAAWSLNKVVEPSGGILEVEYERDDFKNGISFGEDTRYIAVTSFGKCKDYTSGVMSDTAFLRNERYTLKSESDTSKLCLELRPLYWKEACLGPKVAYYDTVPPLGYKGSGYEYLDSLQLTKGKTIYFNLTGNLNTRVQCGFAGIGRCSRTRSVGVFGNGKYNYILNNGNHKLFVLDREFSEVEQTFKRAADKINDRSWSLNKGGARMGFLWVNDTLPKMKGGDIRVAKIKHHDLDRTTTTSYVYDFGELGQLPDSMYNTVLGNRFYSSKVSEAMPTVGLAPKSRIVGLDDDDLFFISGSKITYPKVSVFNSSANNEKLNGSTEFKNITAETGIPEDFIDSATKKVLKPFFKMNVRLMRFGSDTDKNKNKYRGYPLTVILLDSLKNQIGKSVSVLMHEEEKRNVHFYNDQIRKVRFVLIKTSVSDTLTFADTLTYENSWTDFNEVAISTVLDLSKNKFTINKLWERFQQEHFYPILYKEVYYDTVTVNLKNIKGEKVDEQILVLNTEKKVIYHDFSSMLGLNYKTTFYRGNKKQIPVKTDSSVYSTMVPDVLEGFVSNTDTIRTKIGKQVEHWNSVERLNCMENNAGKNDICKKEYSYLYEKESKKDSVHFSYIRYPVFQIKNVTRIGFDNAQNENDTMRMQKTILENHRFDPLLGMPTASLAKAPSVIPGKVVLEKRKLSQNTPFYFYENPLSEEMFKRNMLASTYLQELFVGNIDSTKAWNSIAVADSLRKFSVTVYGEIPDSVLNIPHKPIVSLGTFTNKLQPSLLKEKRFHYLNGNDSLPPFTEYSGTYVQKLDAHFRVKELSDVLGNTLTTVFSPEATAPVSLFFPAKDKEVAILVPYKNTIAKENCEISGAYKTDSLEGTISGIFNVFCQVSGNTPSIVEYRTWSKGKWFTAHEIYLGSSFTLSFLQNDKLNYIRIYPETAEATTSIYNVYGNLIQFISEQNLSTYYTYDAFGRLTEIRNDDGITFKSHHREYRNDERSLEERYHVNF